MRITCSICLELCTLNTISVAGECGHCFHTSCLEIWFQQTSHDCPQCRRKTNKPVKLFIDSSVDVQTTSTTEAELNEMLDQNEHLKQQNLKLKKERNETKKSWKKCFKALQDEKQKTRVLQSKINVLRGIELLPRSSQVFQPQQQQNAHEGRPPNANQPMFVQNQSMTLPGWSGYRMGHFHQMAYHHHQQQPSPMDFRFQQYHQIQQRMRGPYGSNNYGFQ